MDNSFRKIEDVYCAGGAQEALDVLIEHLLKEKDYGRVFQARLLKKRFELGLPLIQNSLFDDLPADRRRAYEAAFVEAAREAGTLFLAQGDIPKAWPYFRAIGDSAPVKMAIENLEQDDNIAAIIDIAFQEQVHPQKGFELILNHYGICRAISSIFQFPEPEGRRNCVALLVRTLHADLVQSLRRAVSRVEGSCEDTRDIRQLVASRDWLFADNCYYVDTSHVMSVVQYSLDLNDPETLSLALELAEYGCCLSEMFQKCGNPPFETFLDYAMYLRALCGQDPEAAVSHFQKKVAECNPEEFGTVPAQVLVSLLARLGRYADAITVSLERLREVDVGQLSCPHVLQLCQAAKDFKQLRKISTENQDIISFTAAVLQD